jgi:trehalose-6-phosphatase
VTDEDGFAVLGGAGLSIRVGPGETTAAFRLENVNEIALALWRIYHLRSAPVRFEE